eukprot:CAMPEP_0167798786 /NCGR_PEP_ID=MMETSP0111_2-20121227/16562_2 /TAXON_ID=91324 /ORGANISM="Lotharella globosa, Strain CCCM811" /LENGTH=72 /DNA_ID=CAMNT_0007693359 /DNA_START=196 /DNA_END=414 /DNA_ORIENTATION=-
MHVILRSSCHLFESAGAVAFEFVVVSLCSVRRRLLLGGGVGIALSSGVVRGRGDEAASAGDTCGSAAPLESR